MRLPKLPQLLERKLYKTGQTRGADDDVIYQNRVLRNSTALIPYSCWRACRKPPEGETTYENGYIVLVPASDYFGLKNPTDELRAQGLEIGVNALVFYETREQWNNNSPASLTWQPATSRTNPLGGQYVARVPAITAENGGKINIGFTTTANKGAGIRVYEYASSATIKKVCTQLEALVWLCVDAEAVMVKYGMADEGAKVRKAQVLKIAQEQGLLDFERLAKARILDSSQTTVCPLCLERFSAEGFLNRMEQAEGREVPDLTVTQLNLFHVDELRVGTFNHRPYNLGWGHHHCNVVVKDSGIEKTLEWMQTVLNRNHTANGLVAAAARGSK